MKEYRLGDIIEIKHGYAFDGDHIVQEDNGIVLVTPGNFRIGGGFQEEKCKFFTGEIPDDYVLSTGDIIVTMTDLSKEIDTLGYSAIVPETNRTYLHNQRIGLVSFKNNECYPLYIFFLMRTHLYQRSIANTSTGSTVHHTSPRKICDYRFSAPSYEKQRRIAAYLFAHEQLIENNQKQIKLLEEAAQRLYKEWFVDLRFPGHETTSVVDGIPEGWNKTNINAVMTFHRGYDLTKNNMVSGKYPVVGSTSIIGYHNQYKICGPGIVTGRSGSLGEYQLIWEDFWPHNTSLYVSDMKGHHVLYLYGMLKTVDFSSLNNGGAIPTLNRNTLSNIAVLEAPQALQQEYVYIAKPYYQAIRRAKQQILYLQEARDRLLPKLMSGEIEV